MIGHLIELFELILLYQRLLLHLRVRRPALPATTPNPTANDDAIIVFSLLKILLKVICFLN